MELWICKYINTTDTIYCLLQSAIVTLCYLKNILNYFNMIVALYIHICVYSVIYIHIYILNTGQAIILSEGQSNQYPRTC